MWCLHLVNDQAGYGIPIRSNAVDPAAANIGTYHPGLAEIGIVEIAARKLCSAQIGIVKVGVRQVTISELGIAEMAHAEQRALTVAFAEGRIHDAGSRQLSARQSRLRDFNSIKQGTRKLSIRHIGRTNEDVEKSRVAGDAACKVARLKRSLFNGYAAEIGDEYIRKLESAEITVNCGVLERLNDSVLRGDPGCGPVARDLHFKAFLKRLFSC